MIIIDNYYYFYRGFTIGRDHSQEEAYKDLQSAGVGLVFILFKGILRQCPKLFKNMQ